MIFIRPWFLLLIVVPFLLWFFKKGLAPSNHLAQFVDKKLVPFVSVRFMARKERKTAKGLGLLWFAFVLAGSGPAFQHVEAPAVVSAPGSVIVLDLSPAMSGENLAQAKLKIYDLLNDLKGHQVGLVLYDQKGYVASPLTQDLGIVRTMVPALANDALPLGGNKPEKGFLKADELFKNAGADGGQIIFITAGGFEEKPLVDLSKNMPYRISILGIGKPEGTPIALPDGGFMRAPDGTLELAKINSEEMSKVGTFIPATSDTTDVWEIVSQAKGPHEAKKAADNTALVWQDLGPYILLCTIPFFLVLFRWGVLFALLFFFSFSAEAGVFLRPDQEMYFEQKAAISAYRAGDFETAKAKFAMGYMADDAYNEGNARAHLNDITGAIVAYKKALGLNPAHEEAKFNKEYLEKQLPPEQQPQENKDQDQNQDQTQVQNEPENSQKNNDVDNQTQEQKNSEEAKNKSEENENSTDMRPDTQPSDSDAQNSPKEPNQELVDSGDMEQSAEAKPDESGEMQGQEIPERSGELPEEQKEQSIAPSPKFDQESQQLFNRVQRDPSRLLRYRLYQQAHKDDETASEEIEEQPQGEIFE